VVSDLTSKQYYYFQVECGTIHTLFLTSTGSVYLWEDVTQVSEGVNSSPLQLVDTVTDAVFVSCDFGFSLALTADGSIYSWGSNQYGQVCFVLFVSSNLDLNVVSFNIYLDVVYSTNIYLDIVSSTIYVDLVSLLAYM